VASETQEGEKMKSYFPLLSGGILLFSLTLATTLVSWSRANPNTAETARSSPSGHKLQPPSDGKPIIVAFVLTDGVTMIDFAGPWEVFQDAGGPDGIDHFHLFTVGASKDPVHTSGGMTVVPDYTFDDSPPARIVVIPAQRGAPELAEWLRRKDKETEVMMSVCTGAFQLGKAGLLDGKPATTHHNFYDAFEKNFPKATLVKGRRYVQSDEVIYTAGGLTSGIDLALHIVDQYFGRDVAQKTAEYMEYESTRWKE
jgi:transcriptional regulator GlxA family with amidase domain